MLQKRHQTSSRDRQIDLMWCRVWVFWGQVERLPSTAQEHNWCQIKEGKTDRSAHRRERARARERERERATRREREKAMAEGLLREEVSRYLQEHGRR